MSVDYGDGAIFARTKMSVDYGKRSIWLPTYNLPNVILLGFGQVESHLIHTVSEKGKNDKSKVRTRADRLCLSTVLPSTPA